ncbi:hypothetical protein LBMAG27_25220 [Bacteroidota bacterium]|nr:hypothetical protein LBMAG27_25220 [Bacteroidota bacterium]
MKKIIQTLVLVLILGLTSNIVHAQCPDSSDATLKETTDWLKSKIESHGRRNVPPTVYKVKFDSTQMTLYEFGIDENFLLTDTVWIVKINLKDLDINKFVVRNINKEGTRFGITIYSKSGKLISRSPTLAADVINGFELIMFSKDEPDLSKRMIKAFIHGYCASGGGSSTTTKEKF